VADQIRLEGVKETLRLLDAVQPGSIRELRKDIRRIAEPAVTAIRSNLPAVSPLSGMNHYGRTRYAGAHVKSEVLTKDNKSNNTSSLIRLSVESPEKSGASGLEIADMAGRRTMTQGPQLPYQYKGRGRIGGSGRQNPTRSRGVVRRGQSREFSYRINGQGKAMIQNLKGIPSRYVYPPLEGRIFPLRDDMIKTLDAYIAKINQKLKVR
jgi:hypothetical protein